MDGSGVPCPSRRQRRRCVMIVIVVDAGVLATALGDDGADGFSARSRLRGHSLAAPALIDLEVTSVFRRHLAAGQLSAQRAERAVIDLAALPIRRAEHRLLLHRCWELRNNLTVYDAAYVALAEALGVVLVTTDARVSRAPTLRCEVELLG